MEENIFIPFVFSVVYDGGSDYVPYVISPWEEQLILAAREEGNSFSDCRELSDLYERVKEAAEDMLLADFEEEGESVDVDALHLVIGF